MTMLCSVSYLCICVIPSVIHITPVYLLVLLLHINCCGQFSNDLSLTTSLLSVCSGLPTSHQIAHTHPSLLPPYCTYVCINQWCRKLPQGGHEDSAELILDKGTPVGFHCESRLVEKKRLPVLFSSVHRRSEETEP